jgi:hypothetical protein
MILATPLGLLALLAIPAIIAIHLFRRRFPVQPVAGLFLWQAIRATPEGGGRIATLPITTSLILECLVALALALILAGARLSPAGVSQHLVVLLDDSASMAAVSPQGESARDRAVRRVLAEIDGLRAAARVTLVRSGDRPSVLAGPAALAAEARLALNAWTPDAPHHSLALGIQLARELAGTTGALIVVSDLASEPRGEKHFERGLWMAVGASLPNVGITAATRTLSPDEGRGTVSLTLVNHADAPARRRLSVSAGDKEVLGREVDVPAGASSLALPLPPGLPAVRVTLSDDALLRDNSVTLAEPRPQVVAVENHLREGRGRQALIKALGALSGVTSSATGHLAFVEAADLDGPAVPGTWRAGIGRAPATWLAAGEPEDVIGPFVLEKRHPLLLGMTLGGVAWTGALPLVPGAAHPLVSAGDRILVGARTASPAGARIDPVLLFNLDLERTNLIRAPDWPILVSNLVEMRRQSLPGPERWNYRIGEWVRVKLGRDPRGPLRFRSGTLERALPAGRDLEFIAPSPGGLLQILEGDDVLFELGVNFLDEVESNLRQQTTGDAGERVAAAGLRTEGGPASDAMFWVLLAIGGTAMLANWSLPSRSRERSERFAKAGRRSVA